VEENIESSLKTDALGDMLIGLGDADVFADSRVHPQTYLPLSVPERSEGTMSGIKDENKRFENIKNKGTSKNKNWSKKEKSEEHVSLEQEKFEEVDGTVEKIKAYLVGIEKEKNKIRKTVFSKTAVGYYSDRREEYLVNEVCTVLHRMGFRIIIKNIVEECDRALIKNTVKDISLAAVIVCANADIAVTLRHKAVPRNRRIICFGTSKDEHGVQFINNIFDVSTALETNSVP